MTDIRQFVPGQFWQGKDEEQSYTVTVTNWATAPTAACFLIYEGASDRGASNFQSAASAGSSINGAAITTPCLVKLRAGIDYRVEVRFEQGGEAFEGYFVVTGQT